MIYSRVRASRSSWNMVAKRNPSKRHAQELDVEKYNTPNSQQRYRDPNTLGINLPNDIPVHMRAFRLMGEIKDSDTGRTVGALEGWTVQLDAFTFGVTVYLRIGRDGTLRVFAEDEDGREKLTEWQLPQQ